ncbi:Fructose-2,6-bisphosphatase [Podila verticillata]|nr:Fructose-2,6-bisphosphatase [Podila verticillata]KFH66190.1 fructose-2,6-bisphosphatase [Podila verticillata NRRL 6337]
MNPGSRIACVMVGLPARGKTLISQKVCRYLQWLGINTRVFNVGNYRRKLHGAQQPHDFFDPANPEGERSRREAAVEALNDMIRWFKKDDGVVALYDATNSTRARREMLLAACKKHDIQVMFIESICQDESLVLHNIMDVKLSSPDYEDMDPEQAAEDFKARIVHYEEAYETITEENLTYIKLINVGSQVIISHIQGYLQSRIVYYLMNLHIAPRSIFFSRHGESLFNVMGKLGGDSDLSARGKQYARSLPLLIATHLGNSEQLTVWTSTMRRTIATAEHLTYPKLQWKALDELDAGVCDGMTYEEIEEQFPEDFANRDDDKFNYRYRGGESYRDVVLRLEPVIMDLERQRNILIIGHQAILRCIYAYFMNHSHEKLPYIKIPLHTVIQLTPRAYTCEEKRFKVDIEAVDTHRPKPKAGAPKSAAEIPLTELPSEVPVNGDATITTTTMSTTTFKDGFKDGVAHGRSKAKDTSAAAGPCPVPAPAPEEAETAKKAQDIQDAMVEATAVSNALKLDQATPVVVGSLGDVSTPPHSPVPAVSSSSQDVPLLKAQVIANGLATPVPTTLATQEEDASGSEKTLGSDDESTSASTTAATATTTAADIATEDIQNLSIKTMNLKAAPNTSLLRDLLTQNPTAVWQEGPEYELTAGGSPRDPIMSPGGRLLPKTENWHFP